MHKSRDYRNLIHQRRLSAYRVAVKETDLFIHSKENFSQIATELVLKYRGYIETHIKQHPAFAASLVPLNVEEMTPEIIKVMTHAGKNAGVGPMAAVAGAIAQFVAIDLLQHTEEIIIENGGDIFIKTETPLKVGIFAGNSPLSCRVGVSVNSSKEPVAVCTSSGTVGHSLSMGSADAVCVKSASCAIADAAATAIANRVKNNSDIKHAIEYGKHIKGVSGLIIIRKETMGVWGDLEVIAL